MRSVHYNMDQQGKLWACYKVMLEKGKGYLLTKRLFCYKLHAPKTLVLLQNVSRNQVCREHKSQQSVVEIGRGMYLHHESHESVMGCECVFLVARMGWKMQFEMSWSAKMGNYATMCQDFCALYLATASPTWTRGRPVDPHPALAATVPTWSWCL